MLSCFRDQMLFKTASNRDLVSAIPRGSSHHTRSRIPETWSISASKRAVTYVHALQRAPWQLLLHDVRRVDDVPLLYGHDEQRFHGFQMRGDARHVRDVRQPFYGARLRAYDARKLSDS